MMMLSLIVIRPQLLQLKKNPVRVTNDPKEMPEKVKIMLARLDEIKMNDKSSLKRSEKKEVRKEVLPN
ncbi:hypothetical protein ACM55M_17305 [Flavobacterium sp. ZT3R25]|uniref:hypothetical protein n=1 Tax=Flavobacterium galactosi TaxID=3398735 RepID=UPI003A847386